MSNKSSTSVGSTVGLLVFQQITQPNNSYAYSTLQALFNSNYDLATVPSDLFQTRNKLYHPIIALVQAFILFSSEEYIPTNRILQLVVYYLAVLGGNYFHKQIGTPFSTLVVDWMTLVLSSCVMLYGYFQLVTYLISFRKNPSMKKIIKAIRNNSWLLFDIAAYALLMHHRIPTELKTPFLRRMLVFGVPGSYASLDLF